MADMVIAVSLLSRISGGLGAQSVKARPAAKKLPKVKLSKDLLEHVRNARGYERVRVIVQPSSRWDKAHDDEVQAHGGEVKQQFDNLAERVVELPTHAVELLASRDDVEYVSPDREIEATGHLLTTTGAGLLTATSGKGNLDGTGIGIAIFDSASIARTSPSMRPAKQSSRAGISTGEGILSDPTVTARTSPRWPWPAQQRLDGAPGRSTPIRVRGHSPTVSVRVPSLAVQGHAL